jgi:hypothetical protein
MQALRHVAQSTRRFMVNFAFSASCDNGGELARQSGGSRLGKQSNFNWLANRLWASSSNLLPLICGERYRKRAKILLAVFGLRTLEENRASAGVGLSGLWPYLPAGRSEAEPFSYQTLRLYRPRMPASRARYSARRPQWGLLGPSEGFACEFPYQIGPCSTAYHSTPRTPQMVLSTTHCQTGPYKIIVFCLEPSGY